MSEEKCIKCGKLSEAAYCLGSQCVCMECNSEQSIDNPIMWDEEQAIKDGVIIANKMNEEISAP